MTQRLLFDPGLQPERTELAWRRTALAIGVGSLIALRVVPAIAPSSQLQQAWLVPGIVGVAFAVMLWLRSRVRHARVNEALLEDRPERMPGAGLLLVLTLFVGGCGILSAVIVLLPHAV
ncbi:DUF202 domain-containing protein [Microbacterium sp. HD4P20]|uniref:DUF202 domain-containing protein n=1 Tax=Microbacterium sp. HD4P20 TaxID=2864874 RepID=UPI001C63BF7B|nr:DUF202 domain-containing protein [Microbacterium sp. HD4P20]MCP2636641.1 DUF202 domain-containing protein [Microbacterium sp. HD4P20]